MKYLKTYKESITFDGLKEIRYLIDDCLIDLIHGDMTIYVESNDTKIKVTINRSVKNGKGSQFSFNDIKGSINQLISTMSDHDGGFTLIESRYYIVSHKPGYASTIKWNNISMDPSNGEIFGDEILKIVNNSRALDSDKDISNEESLLIFELTFEEDNSYEIEESDSWAGSLYAYDTKGFGTSKSYVIEELPVKKTTHYKCNNCGIKFHSFIEECKKCGSEDIEKLS